VNPDNTETLLATVPSTQLQTTITGLDVGAYSFVVRARNVRGTSDRSVAYILPAKPVPPQNVQPVLP
jgi:hypothetical protein